MPLQQALPNTLDLPTETPAMPEPVKVAAASAREAGLAYETAANEKGAADAAIKQAEEVDKAADRAAVAAGKSLSSKSAVPEAKDAAELAGRRLDATRAAYRAAFNELVGAITEHREEWTAAVNEQRDEAREAMRSSLNGFAEARARHGAAIGTLSTLEPFVEGFARPWTSFPRAQRGASGPDSVRDDVVRTLSGRRRFTIAEDQINRVLVELEFLGAGEKPWGATIGEGNR
jgi:hypothetical protein